MTHNILYIYELVHLIFIFKSCHFIFKLLLLQLSVEKYIKHLNKNGVRIFQSTENKQMIALTDSVTVTEGAPRVQ